MPNRQFKDQRRQRTTKAKMSMTKDGTLKPEKPQDKDKDLIRIRNIANDEVHKMACQTCVNGHRAPLCSPFKHAGKILFRRPPPGRPARNCGHAKSANCDCISKRSLCTVLTPDQWDQLRRGEIPTAVMFVNQEHLEMATMQQQRNAELAANLATISQPDPYMSTYPHMPIRLGHGDMQMQQHAQPQQQPQPQQYQQQPQQQQYQPQPQPPPQQQQQQQQLDMQLGRDLATLPPWTTSESVYGQPALNSFAYSQYPVTQDSTAGTSLQVYGTGEPVDWSANAYSDVNDTRPYTGTPVFNPAAELAGYPDYEEGMWNLQQGQGLDLDNLTGTDLVSASEPGMPALSATPTQPPPPMVDPMFSSYPTFFLPSSAPGSQFPCAKCSSRDCQCLRCPDTRQDQTGAWAGACGRVGH